MRRIVLLTSLMALAGLGGAARADRDARAESVFDLKCANCHTLGHAVPDQRMSRKKVDLTGAAQRRGAEALKRWMDTPRPEKEGEAPCEAPNLDAVERDLVLGLLSARSRPETVRPKPAPARFKPPKPDRTAPRPTGMGDRR